MAGARERPVGMSHGGREPRSRRTRARCGTAGDDRVEGTVECHAVGARAQAPAQAARDVHATGRDDRARIRRPPQHRVIRPEPRKTAAPVRRQERRGLEIATHREQPVRIAKRLAGRRQGRGEALLAHPQKAPLAGGIAAAHGARRNGAWAMSTARYSSYWARSERRKVSTALAKRGSASQCAEWVSSGTNPRASLCSPCAPAS